MQLFYNLPNHNTYVLKLYRHTLRNININCESVLFQRTIRESIKTTIVNNRINKSSWSVFNLLTKLENLNKHLQNRDFIKIKHAINPDEKTKAIKRLATTISELESSNKTTPQDPNIIREMNILDKYLKIKQSQGQLPTHISKKYKHSLLLPVALNWNALNKIERIKNQLDKGVPPVTLNYTKAGKSKIWFIRSPINKQKSQSPKLSKLISNVKKENQWVVDSLIACEENAQLALHEAIWEIYNETGKLEKYNLSISLQKVDKLRLLQSYNKNESITNSSTLPYNIVAWLMPICEAMGILQGKLDEREKYFEEYKDKTLINGGYIDFYEQKTKLMYDKRKLRFEKMIKEDVPLAFPFVQDRSLPSILKRNKL